MKDVNLSSIYLYLVRFHGVKSFEVFSDVDKKSLSLKETIIEFYYDKSIKVNHKRLQRILQRDIKNVNKFFVVVEDSKIVIHLDYTKKSQVDFDFEFSAN